MTSLFSFVREKNISVTVIRIQNSNRMRR